MIDPPRLTKPGVFITATDTEVGKTVVTCAIAAALKRSGHGVGVCKPIASDCRRERETLISEDTEALAHFSDCQHPLHTITPVRYREPLAPAVAAERERRPVDYDAIGEALARLDRDPAHDFLLIEGIGGIMVPLDADHTVLDLMRAIGYPVVVVTRPTLGTLNHTAMTCQLVRDAGLRLAGLVINRYNAESGDIAEATNPPLLAGQSKTSVLATIPDAAGVAPERAQLPGGVIEAAALADWRAICKQPKLART